MSNPTDLDYYRRNFLERIAELEREVEDIKQRMLTQEAAVAASYLKLEDMQEINERLNLAGLPPTWPEVLDHFRASTLDPAWSWAATPFGDAPPTVTIADSWIKTTGYSAAERNFLYRSIGATALGKPSGLFALHHAEGDWRVGIRMDDGTDDNYSEALIRSKVDGSNNGILVAERRFRQGGGIVTSTVGLDINVPAALILNMDISGTQWSSWQTRTIVGMVNNNRSRLWMPNSPMAGNNTWTPSRAGILFEAPASPETWIYPSCDFINFGLD